MTYQRKLNEAALPLEAINKESAWDTKLHDGQPRLTHMRKSKNDLTQRRKDRQEAH